VGSGGYDTNRPEQGPVAGTMDQIRPHCYHRGADTDDRAQLDWSICSLSDPIRWRPGADPGQKQTPATGLWLRGIDAPWPVTEENNIGATLPIHGRSTNTEDCAFGDLCRFISLISQAKGSRRLARERGAPNNHVKRERRLPRRLERFLPSKWIAAAILVKILIPQMDQNGGW